MVLVVTVPVIIGMLIRKLASDVIKSKTLSEKEHATSFLRKDKNIKKYNLKCPISINKFYRWTLDTNIDLKFFRKIFSKKKRSFT